MSGFPYQDLIDLYYEDKKVTKVVPKELNVKVTDALINKLENILGDGTVKCV